MSTKSQPKFSIDPMSFSGAERSSKSMGIALIFAASFFLSWGFTAHRKIVDIAIHSVPDPLHPFFKENRNYLVEHALDADLRKHSIKGESEKHFIDLEGYGTSEDNSPCLPPKSWQDAVKTFGEDQLRANGIGPWNVRWQYDKLVEAFATRDKQQILRGAADLAHYVADLHVPLHTSNNYDGAQTNQKGIHALWETQIPESKMHEYNFTQRIDPIGYEPHASDVIWQTIVESHSGLALVFESELQTMAEIGQVDAFSFIVRGRSRQKMRSQAFVDSYHEKLNGQVEERMKMSIHVCALLWYNAWVEAGEPILPQDSTRQKRLGTIIQWLTN
jgi:hypothetical protein